MILVIGYWFLIISYNQQPATSNKMTIKHQLGLIGYPLSHSFSKKYFAEKFQEEKIEGYHYELYPIPAITALPNLIGETTLSLIHI